MIESFDLGEHRFLAIAPDDSTDWLATVANEYIGLRTRCALPLVDISLDGITVVNVERLRARLRSATVPAYRAGNFGIVRSDFGETLCYMLLEQSYGTRFGYKGVQDRELIYLPGRGIDAVGVENGNQLSLVLGEVKVSNENASPPQVVDYSDDSLKHQHRGHLGDLDTTKTKVWDLTRRASEVETRDLLFQAALYLDEERWDSLTLIACCFMVRPQGRYKEADFGSFKRSPRDYAPASMIFFGVRRKEAVWLRMVGVPRIVADNLAQLWEQSRSGEPDTYEGIRDWIGQLTDDDWQGSIPAETSLRPQDMRLIWQELAG